jgi:hypothetical protein
MRKKELQDRNEQLAHSLAKAEQLAADQIRQINEHRMQLALLKVELEMHSAGTGQGAGGTRAAPAVVIPDVAKPNTKVCPDCAEDVRLAARRCRYCDFRFDAAERAWPEDGSKETGGNGSSTVATLGTGA